MLFSLLGDLIQKSLDFPVQQQISLCPECGACPEVEVLCHEGRPVAVRIREGDEKITLPKEAWNTLLKYVRKEILEEL